MIVSLNDINLILENIKNISVDDFISKNHEGFFQLKNKNGRCVFFNSSKKECRIYNYRPKGCQFYPLIYDPIDKRCILDKDCPNPVVLLSLQESRLKICKMLKEYLKEELRII
jgi:Fe-S-cluster containining protein